MSQPDLPARAAGPTPGPDFLIVPRQATAEVIADARSFFEADATALARGSSDTIRFFYERVVRNAAVETRWSSTAAPDLLAALQGMVALWDDIADGDTPARHLAPAALKAGRAALSASRSAAHADGGGRG